MIIGSEILVHVALYLRRGDLFDEIGVVAQDALHEVSAVREHEGFVSKVRTLVTGARFEHAIAPHSTPADTHLQSRAIAVASIRGFPNNVEKVLLGLCRL
eukprot:265988-Prorocentrum_minimum.AAC.22